MNKLKQKEIIVEIMNEDAKDGLYKKQTAVEWFFSELERMQYFIGNDMLEAYKEAKEMEKQQIKNSYHLGTIEGFNFRKASISSISPNSEQYYNEKYGK